MKRWEWFFETEESHVRTIRVIASNLEAAHSLATDHLGTTKFHQITVETFFEEGCDFHTIEEPITEPNQEVQSTPHPVDVLQPVHAGEGDRFDLRAALDSFQADLNSGKALPLVDPATLRRVRDVGKRMTTEHRARGGTGQIGIEIGIYEKECGIERTEMPAIMFRNMLIEMLLIKGDFEEADVNDAMLQAIATIPVDNSFTPDILAQRVREAMGSLSA